jgi:hypothetical protein
MSRKSRRHNTPELVPEPLPIEESVDERFSLHHLTGELHDTLEAIISGSVFLAKGPVPPALLDPDSDEFQALAAEMSETLIDDLDATVDAEEDDTLESEEAALDAEIDQLRDVFAGVTLTIRVLARALIARTLGRGSPTTIEQYYVPTASHAETETESAALDGLTHALLPPNLPPALRPSRTEKKAAFEDAALLVREVGLEEFDVSCDLGTRADGSYELLAFRLSPETAHVELLEFLFDRAEGVALEEDPLLVTERDASSWEFARWSVAPPPGRGSPDIAAFARRVREQEYSLADRPTVALGASVIEELADDETFAELFPRQHRMAAALTASVVGVFECVALDGNRATLRSVRDGSTYVVHEHMEPIEYSTGWVAAGRLIPFEGALHLRSPGTVFAHPDDLELARAAANEVGGLEGTLPPALALEAFISAAMLGVNVPRAVKPMRSKADAREVLAALQLMLAAAELDLDATLEGFIAALVEQAGAGSAGGGKSQTGAKRKAKSKSRSKRRR